MMSGLLVAIVGGWILAQQPQSLVTQTELPPPGAGKAVATQSAPVSAPRPSVSETKKPAPEHANRTAVSAEKNAPAKKTEEPAQTPAPEGGKPSGGSRVPAFWIILPGK